MTLEPEHWESLAHAGPGPDDDAENAALLEAVRDGIRTALTPRQRQVLVTTVLEGVPIDVLAERLDSNRNAQKPVVIEQIKGGKFTYGSMVEGG